MTINPETYPRGVSNHMISPTSRITWSRIPLVPNSPIDLVPNSKAFPFSSPIHSTSLEMSEVSSETDMLSISVPQQTDAAISR